VSQDHPQLEHYEVLMRLAKRKSWGSADLESTLREVAEAASHTMGIERVTVWLFDEHHTKIHCIEQYDRTSGEHTSGAELGAADYPNYFKALQDERTIVADDAHGDPRTREFSKGYLDEYGITSMLDAPLRSGGEVIGIICHEHVGPQRVWSAEEQRLAASLTDLAALAIESSERKRAEDSLRESEKWVREIMAHALDAIIIADENGVITDWNPRAEVVFGWTRKEAIGMTLYETVIPAHHHGGHRRGMERFHETGEGPLIDQRTEISAMHKSGREFPVELGISPIRSGDSLAFSAFIRDITDRVLAQQEVQTLNSELEQRVEERTTQLEAAVREKGHLLEELQASSVELLERLQELEQKSEIIRLDLERAQVIQRALLPGQPPRLDGVHVDALYRPGMSVGGDLYDVAVLGDGQIAIYVADAAGHGVAAAMLSVLFKRTLELYEEDGTTLGPAEVLNRVNAQVAKDVLSKGLFLTAGYVLFDPRTRDLRVASAGHTPMLLRRAGGEHALLERTGPALGLVVDAEFAERRLSLDEGDRLLIYTDGLVDGLGSGGTDEIPELLLPALTGDTRDGPRRLRELFHDVAQRAIVAASDGGRDDVTMLMLEANGGPSSFDNDVSDELSLPDREPAAEPTWTLGIAEDEHETYLAVNGRGSWLQCEMFRRLALGGLAPGRRLTVDLAGCSLLDSAFLGTVHEIVAANPGRVAVHSPSDMVRTLFEELGLDLVLAVINEEPARPPREPSPVRQDAPVRDSQQRLLRAHEILSELSEENREQFAGVVQALRAELREGSE
jgi:PAS domain S-box-containing protein